MLLVCINPRLRTQQETYAGSLPSSWLSLPSLTGINASHNHLTGMEWHHERQAYNEVHARQPACSLVLAERHALADTKCQEKCI